MTKPDAARAFLLAEVESLEPFDFVAAIPSGRPLHMVEVARTEEGRIEVTVAGRPPGFPPLEESERVALTQLGFEGQFDFLYVPIDRVTHWSAPEILLLRRYTTPCAPRIRVTRMNRSV